MPALEIYNGLAEGIQKVYAGSIFNLLHWYAGNGLAENLFVNRKKRKRDVM